MKLREAFYIWLSGKLPDDLVYWAATRLWAETSKELDIYDQGEIAAVQCLKKWRQSINGSIKEGSRESKPES